MQGAVYVKQTVVTAETSFSLSLVHSSSLGICVGKWACHFVQTLATLSSWQRNDFICGPRSSSFGAASPKHSEAFDVFPSLQFWELFYQLSQRDFCGRLAEKHRVFGLQTRIIALILILWLGQDRSPERRQTQPHAAYVLGTARR